MGVWDQTLSDTALAGLVDVCAFSQEWLWETGADGHLNVLSERFEPLVGVSKDALLGRALLDLLAPSPAVSGGDINQIEDAFALRGPFLAWCAASLSRPSAPSWRA